jgi:hypothetical protein
VCCDEGDYDETVELFVEGTPVGGKLVTGHLAADQTIDIPIDRFPLVSLPTTIRLKAAEGTLDPNAEVAIETADQVSFAVGKGEVVLDGYLVEPGSVLISISNVVNGFWTPNVFARFDTGATRVATTESVRRREEGGCQARLRVPLVVGDFHQMGLSFELFCADRDGALAHIEYRRVDPESQFSHVARVAADLRSLHTAQTLHVAAIESDLKQGLAAMESRLETFCEYILALTHDHLAADRDARAAATPDDRLAAGRDDRLAGLLAMFGVASEAKPALSEGARPSAEAQLFGGGEGAPQPVSLPISSECFLAGWHFTETDSDRRTFRWMERTGQIKLPCSPGALICVTVEVGKLFVGETPTFTARINGLQAGLRCLAVASGYELKITPHPSAPGATGGESCVLSLESAAWGTPLNEGLGTDARELSALVRSVQVLAAANA